MINGRMASADGQIKTFPLRGIKDSPPYLHRRSPVSGRYLGPVLRVARLVPDDVAGAEVT